jgi:hypothetical protein
LLASLLQTSANVEIGPPDHLRQSSVDATQTSLILTAISSMRYFRFSAWTPCVPGLNSRLFDQ